MTAVSFADKLRAIFAGKPLSDDLFDDLADLLIEGDFGAAEAFAVTERLEALAKKERAESGDAAKELLKQILLETLAKARHPRMVEDAGLAAGADGGPLSVILLLGVNGAGKTTTAAKLCARYSALSPVLAAADTFRAGAIEQLMAHGERLGARVIAHKSGGDPSAVVFDAVRAAQAGRSRLVIADTAGRMHTKKNLIEELKKINRAVESADNIQGNCDEAAVTTAGAGAGVKTLAKPLHYLKYLTLDATTGRNAVAQAEVFNEAVKLDGVILSKCDSTARGGAAFSLAERFGLPVVFLCSGERYTDIAVFDAPAFVDRFTVSR
jgi:fused signal recognition particle receptor